MESQFSKRLRPERRWTLDTWKKQNKTCLHNLWSRQSRHLLRWNVMYRSVSHTRPSQGFKSTAVLLPSFLPWLGNPDLRAALPFRAKWNQSSTPGLSRLLPAPAALCAAPSLWLPHLSFLLNLSQLLTTDIGKESRLHSSLLPQAQ